MASSQALTDYERQRLENIKRNQEMMMSSFKLPALAAAANQQLTKRNRSDSYNRTPKEKKPKSDRSPVVIRRSLRTRGIPPDATTKDGSREQEGKGQVSSSVTTTEPNSPHRKLGPVVSMRDAFVTSRVSNNDNNQHQKQQHLIHTIKGLSEKALIGQESDDGAGNGGGDGSVIDSRSFILKPENIARIMPGRIMSLNFFPCNDRSLIVAGNKYGNVAFWDVDSNLKDGEEEEDNCIYLYGPHTGPISGITIRPFSLSKVYTSSYDGCVRLFDVEKESFDLVYSSEDAIFCLSDQPHETKSLYFGEAQGVINVWDERAGKSSSSWPLHDQRINTIDFHPENTNLMATSSTDGSACIWDLRSINANQPVTLKNVDHKRAVHSAYFSPSGSCLATTSASNEVGLLRGVDFTDLSMISHNNQTGRWISSFRAIWGWDDSYLFIGNMKRGVDVISTSYRKMVTLESPLMSAIPCRFAAHPYKVGMLAGATSGGQIYIWVSQ